MIILAVPFYREGTILRSTKLTLCSIQMHVEANSICAAPPVKHSPAYVLASELQAAPISAPRLGRLSGAIDSTGQGLNRVT